LAKIKYPTYAIVGNHDEIQSGKISLKNQLEKVLKKNKIKLLYNEKVNLKDKIVLYGVGSHFAGTDDLSGLEELNPKQEKIIFLFHNPDTLLKTFPDKDFSNAITFSGHTHCGQVRIPILYKIATPIKNNLYDNGPYDFGKKGKLLISCGLGESGIPIRLFNRPEILVVDL
jgi:predicted MPP superfamily phosphohydrolase